MRVLKIVILLASAGAIATLVDIVLFSKNSSSGPADAAIVLGAAVFGSIPSPVFEERIRHAVALYSSGAVPLIVMTGGLGEGDTISEAEAARSWAEEQGVPASAILIEAHSRTTYENLTFSLPILRERGIRRVLLVSDPLHMRRAVAMAEKLGLDPLPAPTPTTRYTGWKSWTWFLFAEAYYITRCRLSREC